MFSWLHPPRTPLVIAHRGSSALAPENTLAAFRRAIEDGADAIELDVHLTGDGEVVVIHDSTLRRTTDGRGKVSKKSVLEIQSLNAGAWFDTKFSSERVPTLDEVFHLIDNRIGINIEVKADWRKKQNLTIVDRCCAIIKKHHADRMVTVSSFFPSFIRRVHAIQPHIATGILYHPARHIARSPVELARRLNATYLILSASRVQKRLVQHAHEYGILVGEYTVNTQRKLRRALSYEVDAIFTDDPLKITKVIAEEK